MKVIVLYHIRTLIKHRRTTIQTRVNNDISKKTVHGKSLEGGRARKQDGWPQHLTCYHHHNYNYMCTNRSKYLITFACTTEG